MTGSIAHTTDTAKASDVALLRLAQALGLPLVADLSSRSASDEFVGKVPIAFARRHKIIGLSSTGQGIEVAISNPAALKAMEVVSRSLGQDVHPVVAAEQEILQAINLAYQQRTGAAARVIERLDGRDGTAESELRQRPEDLLDVAARAPIIKVVNLILFEAVQARASDVHIEPSEDAVIVRMRIDGVLYKMFELPQSRQEEVISRVKVMGRMNIAEKRLPQDGRATVQVGDRAVDLRIASLPTSFGERVVIRLLDKSARLYTLEELGMDQPMMQGFRELITLEHGLVLVTGPTGSGKTTTLYAALHELDSSRRNILTLEDPIEFRLEGISQTQVSEKKGMTFAAGLRSVLRQDPDVIMVGEIRDRETAVMAIQSALTGHLVFSTLHTNDAASAVTRLLDLGIEPYLLASSLVGALAQRLVRRICPNCAKPVQPSAADLAFLGTDTTSRADLRIGAGCDHCRNTGYHGRLGIYELLSVDESIRTCISSRATASQIKTAAQQHGMRTLADDGRARALAGKTSLEEVLRATARSNA